MNDRRWETVDGKRILIKQSSCETVSRSASGLGPRPKDFAGPDGSEDRRETSVAEAQATYERLDDRVMVVERMDRGR
jgi:hypothetical protein